MAIAAPNWHQVLADQAVTRGGMETVNLRQARRRVPLSDVRWTSISGIEGAIDPHFGRAAMNADRRW